jgi:anti-sigma B factor antagonist
MEKIHKEILGLMGKIDINCKDVGDVIVIELAGQLDIYNSGDLARLIDAYILRGFKKFAVDLDLVTYWDSSTLSVFINCLKKLEQEKGKFVLASLKGAPREVFEMAKFQQVFQVFASIDSALDALG